MTISRFIRTMMLTARNLLVILFLCLACSVSHAETIYMGPGETYTNLQAAMTAMSAGDTLIIRDGTYTGATNMLDQTHYPPDGSAGAYTIVQAENSGSVIFDGEGARNMFYLRGTNDDSQRKYIHFEGIEWKNNATGSTAEILFADHIKFIKCGASEAHTGDDSHLWSAYYSEYLLFEDCYAYGQGDYGFLMGHNTENYILRRCVVRLDRGVDVENGIIMVGFGMYGTRNGEFQNCVFVDTDQAASYVHADASAAVPYAFMHRVDGTAGQYYGNSNIYARGCISLNASGGVIGSLVAAAGDPTSVHFENFIHWDSPHGSRQYYGGADFDHCTIGAITGTGTTDRGMTFSAALLDDITNSIITGVTNNFGIAGGASRYCALYNNSADYSGVSDKTGDITATDPLGGSLEYLPRIETSSALDGAAEDSGDIGATILYKIGTDGTLYNDTGYNTVTANSLWPFPNEALIKTKMAAYSAGGVSGARGFCATGKQLNGTDDITLTSYIWEYLGNEIPAEIYGTSTVTHSAGGTANWR